MSTISPVELLQNLIRFNTTNPPGNEAECITYINNLLSQAGFETTLVARAPERPNLITRLKGQGNAAPLLLFGHVDVQPAGGQTWQHPPFEGKVVDGYIWGRGTLDMKSCVAMQLTALLRAKAEGLVPAGDVVLAVLSDEEGLGYYGAQYVVEKHASLFEGICYAVGEFGGFTFHLGRHKFYPIQVQEKQICLAAAKIRGQGGHPSVRSHTGTHMTQLARLLTKLEQHRMPVHITPVARQTIEGFASGLSFPANLILRQVLNPRLTDMVLRLLGAKGEAVEPLIRNIVSAWSVTGTSVPSEVDLILVGFLLPGYGPSDMLAELRPIVGNAAEIEVFLFNPAPPDPDMGLFDTLAGILREADPDGLPVPLLLPGTTDACYFGRLGIQTYGFTPMKLPRDMNFWQFMHGADERIPVEAVQFGADMIYRLLQCFR
jgi:acetylornithine deacetylase/succinyl-diaminopimelate desuccinylase-like protein